MKIIYSLILIGIVFIAGCSKKLDPNDACPMEYLNMYIEDKTVTLSFNSFTQTYEIEYGVAGFVKGTGTVKTVSANATITGLDYGTYDIYCRAICEGGGFAKWSTVQSFTLDGSTSGCDAPSSLEVKTYYLSNHEFKWYGSNNYYDVQYGLTGFKLGEGELLRTNSRSTDDVVLEKGKTYDFYVRGNCGGSKFSKWVGPKSFYSEFNQNQGSGQCLLPTNLNAYKINSVEITCSFTPHGGSSYEISFSSNSSFPGNIISTNSTGGTYGIQGGNSGVSYFWVRAKCADGSNTNWVNKAIQ